MIDARTTKLIQDVQAAVAVKAVDVDRVIQHLDSLLQYLRSAEGRTDSNCRFVDAFFMEHNEWADAELPDALHDIFADMAGALHDTCSAPHVAQNFDSTPEQLYQRLRTFGQKWGRT
jgi:hypothetical protein